MEKFLLSLLCLLTVAFAGSAEEKTYQLKFETGTNTNGTAIKTSDSLTDLLSEGKDYVTGTIKSATNVYYGTPHAIKFGASKKSGELSFELSSEGSVKVTAITLNGAYFDNDKDANMFFEIFINDTSVGKIGEFLKNELSEKTLELSEPIEMSSLKFVTGNSNGNVSSNNQARGYIETITIKYVEDTSDPTKEDAEVSFGEDSKRVYDLYNTTIDSFKTPVLTKTEGISVSFESSDTNVATVSETGEVTLTGELGSTRITASFAGDESYNAASDYYTITVSKAFANVKDVLACANGTQGLVDFPLTVAYAHGKNVFAFDAAGDFIQVYGENSYNANDVIPAGWKANYTLYSDCTPELVPVDAVPTAVETAEFTAKVVDAKDVTAELVNSVLKLNNVTFDAETPADVNNFTGVSNEVELTFRNAYQLESQAAGKYNVTFVVNLYMAKNATEAVLQLYPIAFEAVEAEKPAAPEFAEGHEAIKGDLIETTAETHVLKFKKVEGIDIYYRFTKASDNNDNSENPDVNGENTQNTDRSIYTTRAEGDVVADEEITDGKYQGYYKHNDYDNGVTISKALGHTGIEFLAVDSQSGLASDPQSLRLDFQSAVAEVEMAEGEAKYFDLQGREVKGAPESGIYVRVKNGKSTKVLIK